MAQIEIFILLLGIIAIVGLLARKVTVPISLLLVIIGMLVSLIPFMPEIHLKSNMVLDIILPLLIYEMSAESSWREMKINLRPIISLSIGHVLFIATLVAVLIHSLIPDIGWPLAFVLGAVVAPPDDVAIMAIAEKANIPQRVLTILKSEAMLNDATALILFRFSLAALLTHEFSASSAFGTFLLIVLGETFYGLALGNFIGKLRLTVTDPRLQMLFSFLTPFLAYLPAERLGGCGVLATAVTGLVIGHRYFDKFLPEVRLVTHSVWTSISFGLQSILFLLVGLNLKYVIDRADDFFTHQKLLIYSIAVTLTVMIGRFIWTYGTTYLPRLFMPSLRKKDPYPPWQYPFVTSWAGMRGAISLAAAFAIPPLTFVGGNSRDLIILFTFAVICTTLLIQGLTLPWILKHLSIEQYRQQEKKQEEIIELKALKKMTHAAITWLKEYEVIVKENQPLVASVQLHIEQYKMRKKQLAERLKALQGNQEHDDITELTTSIHLGIKLI
ncbi:MAG TPA: sodium:proton antiporter, partial [Candidatus Berkiella sp.]|nr:sodium:proton antiporter [Candidatus Berkiella sp.]